MSNIENRILALAGIAQAASIVKSIARGKPIPNDSVLTSIKSIFKINADSVSEIYGGKLKLKLGLNELKKILSSTNIKKDPEIARYTMCMIHLERKLMKRPELLDLLQNGIRRAEHQSKIFDILHDNVMANLANIYVDTISTFSFKVHVSGDRNILSNNHSANKVRALLLAGIRSAVLWRQLGGSRWHLVLNRKTMINQIDNIILSLSKKEEKIEEFAE